MTRDLLGDSAGCISHSSKKTVTSWLAENIPLKPLGVLRYLGTNTNWIEHPLALSHMTVAGVAGINSHANQRM